MTIWIIPESDREGVGSLSDLQAPRWYTQRDSHRQENLSGQEPLLTDLQYLRVC